MNAYWNDNCFCMVFGDGNSSNGNTPLVSLDVAGHELTHGVTSNTAGLIYSGESGGLNESTSDIFGTMVEFSAANSNDPGDYYIGEKLNWSVGNAGALRRMDDPTLDGGSKGCWYSGVGDLDVHYSSGIGNHFFYLLSEGSGAKTIGGRSHNGVTCNSSTVAGIGRTKAAAVYYNSPHSGTRYAWLLGNGTTATEYIAQTVTVPASGTKTLRYYLAITTQETGSVVYDKVQVQVNGITLQTWSNVNAGGYLQRSLDLSAYAGQSVTLRFYGTEDAYLATNFLFDDITLS